MAVVEMSATVAALIVQAAAKRGVEPAQLAAVSGFDLSMMQDPDARISIELETRLWTEAARLAKDCALGVHAAELLEPA